MQSLLGTICQERSFSFPQLPTSYFLDPLAHGQHHRTNIVTLSVPFLRCLLLMSTSVDTRRRTGIWSYIPFGSTTPRRRSVSLPYRANSDISDPFDPFEKPNRHSSSSASHHSSLPTLIESLQNAWMTQSQRSRYVKTGGVVVFILLLLFFFSGGRTGIPSVGSTHEVSQERILI